MVSERLQRQIVRLLDEADVREEDGRKLEAEITEAGGEAIFVALDVSQEDQWQSAVAQVVSQFGRLDILVNNAGGSGGGEGRIAAAGRWGH